MNALNTLGMCLTALMLVSAPTVADNREDGSTSEPTMASLDVPCEPVTWVNGHPVVRPECVVPPFP